jgi:predicted alpha/beta-fold hydrolase
LLLSSSDDPFLPPQVLDEVAVVAGQNDFLATELWSKGGHVGFVSGPFPLDTHYYHEERVVEFLGLQDDRASVVHTP